MGALCPFGRDSIRKQSGKAQDKESCSVVVHIPMVLPRRTWKTVHLNGEARWRGWAVVVAVGLGILAGAMAAGRLKFPIPW